MMLQPVKLPAQDLLDEAWVLIEITKVINSCTWNKAGQQRAINRIKEIIELLEASRLERSGDE